MVGVNIDFDKTRNPLEMQTKKNFPACLFAGVVSLLRGYPVKPFRKRLLAPALMSILMSFSAYCEPGAGQGTEHFESEPDKTANEESDSETVKAEKKQSAYLDFLEREKEWVDSASLRTAQWVDSFFSDPEYEAEMVTSQFRLRPEISYRAEQGFDGTLKASFKYRLPNLERKVSLVGGSSDFDEDFDAAVDDDVNEPAIGLQFFGKQRKEWAYSVSVGVKFNDFAGFMGPRIRYATNWTERTSFRYVQKILWQTNSEWQFRSRFDVNVAINDRFFFRQMVDARWRGEYSDEEGLRTRVSSFLTSRLSRTSGLQNEATAVFHTEPDTHVDEYILALRYRKQAWREWFYYEIVPQVTWEDEFDYKLNPGIRFRIEVFYGASQGQRYWRREAEDTNDFRW